MASVKQVKDFVSLPMIEDSVMDVHAKLEKTFSKMLHFEAAEKSSGGPAGLELGDGLIEAFALGGGNKENGLVERFGVGETHGVSGA